MAAKVFRNGKVHVCATMCDSCIFRPGNVMRLQPGRVEQMVRDATQNDSCIPCHETIHTRKRKPAVCAGFFAKHRTMPLQLAERLGRIEFVQP